MPRDAFTLRVAWLALPNSVGSPDTLCFLATLHVRRGGLSTRQASAPAQVERNWTQPAVRTNESAIRRPPVCH